MGGHYTTRDEVRIEEIKAVIPPSCFIASTWKSLAYLARDIVYASVLVFLALQIHLIPSLYLRIAAWVIYGFVQGCVGTGLWILGHECGHGAFSRHTRLNDTVGWAVHSFLLVPYFSWKITHARHHRYTNHPEKDPVFVPTVKSSTNGVESDVPASRFQQIVAAASDTPAMCLAKLVLHQLFGWQTYLFMNATAGQNSLPQADASSEQSPKMESHFNPFSRLFLPSQRLSIAISDLGVTMTLVFLYFTAQRIGWTNVALLYFVPYFWVHHWLIAITFLHHVKDDVPRHTAEEWTYTRGALGTIDRSAGFIGRHFMHDIIDHHVVHHLFPRIPFYNCEEATTAARHLLDDQYLQAKDDSFHQSLFDTFSKCNYMSPGESGKTHENVNLLYWRP